jgi:hypothetical protein
VSEELKECHHCGTKNAISSFSCYACGKPLPEIPSEPLEAEKEDIEIKATLSICDICRAIGAHRNSLGSRCVRCQYNPNRWRDLGCGCLFAIILFIIFASIGAIL